MQEHAESEHDVVEQVPEAELPEFALLIDLPD